MTNAVANGRLAEAIAICDREIATQRRFNATLRAWLAGHSIDGESAAGGATPPVTGDVGEILDTVGTLLDRELARSRAFCVRFRRALRGAGGAEGGDVRVGSGRLIREARQRQGDTGD
jgi:hypothetical protein